MFVSAEGREGGGLHQSVLILSREGIRSVCLFLLREGQVFDWI